MEAERERQKSITEFLMSTAVMGYHCNQDEHSLSLNRTHIPKAKKMKDSTNENINNSCDKC